MSRPRFYGAASSGYDEGGRIVVDAYVFDRLDCYRIVNRKTYQATQWTRKPARAARVASLLAEALAWAEADAAQRLATVTA